MQYRAFFSYSRSDDRIANWLHRQLDGYRTPRALIGINGALGPVPAKLHPIFRDRTDMSGGGQLSERIEKALKDSEALIVLCSPASAASPWVNREVERFIASGRSERIFPVIATGLPDTDDVERDFFPPALRDLGLLAADLREIRLAGGKLVGDGREGGRLKLIAGVLGVGLDQLAQRERRRQRLLVAGLSSAAMLFAAVAVAAGGLGWLAQMRAEAEKAARELAAQNEERALRGEAEARRERDAAITARDAEARQRARADYNAEQAEIQEMAARRGEADARDALARIFAERGWQAIESQNLALAARYALAGWRSSPNNEAEYRALLANVLFTANDSIRLTADHGPLGAVSISENGRLIATAAEDGRVVLWDGDSGALQRTIDAHTGPVRSAGFSLDSQRLLTASRDGTARVWDVATAAQISSFDAQAGEFNDATISSDGRFVLTTEMIPLRHPMGTYRRGPVTLWDAKTGVRLHTLDSEAGAAVFSGDGARVAAEKTGDGGQSEILVWNSASGEQIARFASGQAGIWSLRLNQTGDTLVSGSQDQTANVWNVSQPGEAPTVLSGHTERINNVSLSGDRVLTASDDGQAIVWDTGGERRSVLRGHRGPVRGGVFAFGGAIVYTYSSDGAAGVWSAGGGLFGWFLGHDRPVTGLAVNPSNASVVTVSTDGDARLWRHPFGRLLTWHSIDERRFSGVEFVANDPVAVMFDMSDRTLEVWQAATSSTVRYGESSEQIDDYVVCDSKPVFATTASGRLRAWRSKDAAPFIDTHIEALSGLACGGQYLLAATSDHVYVFDAEIGRAVADWAMQAGDPRFREIQIVADGKRVLVHDNGQALALFDTATGNRIFADSVGLSDLVSVSSRGSIVAIVREDLVELRNARTGRLISSVSEGGFQRIAISESANRIVAYSTRSALPGQRRNVGRGMLVFELSSGRPLGAFPAIAGDDAYFNDRLGLMASWSTDGVVQVWDVSTISEVSTLRGHQSIVKAVAFSARGDRVVTGANDGTIRIWDVRTGREIALLPTQGALVEHMSMSDDDDELIATSYSVDRSNGAMLSIVRNTAQLWDVDVLFLTMPELAARACSQFLTDTGRHFSSVEVAADPLIRSVWTGSRSRSGDVCE